MSDIIKALETLKENKWIDLTHNVNSSIPKFGAFPNLNIETLYTIEKDGFFVDRVSFVTQYGTHIDAPIHFSENKRTLEQLELKELVLPLFVINKEKEVENNSRFYFNRRRYFKLGERKRKNRKRFFCSVCKRLK